MEFAEADAQRARRIEAIRYEADLARRRFFEVDPANRLVAASLEADWNERLRDLEEACREREARAAAHDTELSERQVERIRELARDFEQVWNAAQTGNADRKRLLGLLIEDATLTRDGNEVTRDLRMRGGRSLTLEPLQLPRPMAQIRKTPPETVAALDRLLETHGDEGAARELNGMGCRNWMGEPFTAKRVGRVRRGLRLAQPPRARDETASRPGLRDRRGSRRSTRLHRENRPGAGQNCERRAGGSGNRLDRRPATILHVQSELRRRNGAVAGTLIGGLKMPPRNDAIAPAGALDERRYGKLSRHEKGPAREAPARRGRENVRDVPDLERDRFVQIRRVPATGRIWSSIRSTTWLCWSTRSAPWNRQRHWLAGNCPMRSRPCAVSWRRAWADNAYQSAPDPLMADPGIDPTRTGRSRRAPVSALNSLVAQWN